MDSGNFHTDSVRQFPDEPAHRGIAHVVIAGARRASPAPLDLGNMAQDTVSDLRAAAPARQMDMVIADGLMTVAD
jgi:hypothetical protein